MDRNEWLDAYGKLPPADRVAIRAQLIREGGYDDAPGVGSVMAACISIMEEARAGRDPVKYCEGMLEEMAAMCTD